MMTFFSRLLPALFVLAAVASVEAQSGSAGAGSRPTSQAGSGNRPPASQPPPPQNGVSPAPWQWWKLGSEFNARLHLSVEQSNRIQQIFDTQMKQIRSQSDELDRHLEKLSKYIQKDETIDLISQQIDRVEATRGALNKTRTLMLLEMRRVLNPPQRTQFEALSAEWMKQRERDQQRQQNQNRPDDNRRADPTPDRGRPGL